MATLEETTSAWTAWTTTTSDTQTVWADWCDQTTTSDGREQEHRDQLKTFWKSPPTRTPKEIQREKLVDARSRGIIKREQRKKARVEKRAKKFLLELIGKVDYEKFCRSGYIDVEGRSGKIYRIEPGSHIKVFDGKDKLDVAIKGLCIETPNYYLLPADEVIWKKLLIEADEEKLLRVANHHSA